MTRRRAISGGVAKPSRPPKPIRDWFAGGPPTIAAYIFPENQHVRGWWLEYTRVNPNATLPIDGEWLLQGESQ